ncbi:hypothetical protein IPJ72_02820 [Candidatus Peregrinibacteria bacterium]|nr:MAG: hypothetical protein IPJ72_02820 [Candidatus Peregrinibacteria bacterium]
MNQPKTIFTIGGATIDHFIKAPGHKIMRLEGTDHSDQWMCLPYGAKIKIDHVQETFGGGDVTRPLALSGWVLMLIMWE